MQNTKLGSKRVVLLTGLSRIIWMILIFSTAEKDHVLHLIQAHGAHGVLLYVSQLLLQLHYVLRLVVYHHTIGLVIFFCQIMNTTVLTITV